MRQTEHRNRESVDKGRGGKETQRERQRDTERDRQTQTDRDRDSERETDRETGTQTETERKWGGQTDWGKHRNSMLEVHQGLPPQKSC